MQQVKFISIEAIECEENFFIRKYESSNFRSLFKFNLWNPRKYSVNDTICDMSFVFCEGAAQLYYYHNHPTVISNIIISGGLLTWLILEVQTLIFFAP